MTNFFSKCCITCSWCAVHKPPEHNYSAEPFPLNIHGTLLSPWTSPSLCCSSLISSPRCLFRSWESLNSCTRLAWKYQHIRRYNQKRRRGQMWGFIRLGEVGVQAQLSHTKPIRVKACMNAASVRIRPRRCLEEMKLALNLHLGMFFVSRIAHR